MVHHLVTCSENKVMKYSKIYNPTTPAFINTHGFVTNANVMAFADSTEKRTMFLSTSFLGSWVKTLKKWQHQRETDMHTLTWQACGDGVESKDLACVFVRNSSVKISSLFPGVDTLPSVWLPSAPLTALMLMPFCCNSLCIKAFLLIAAKLLCCWGSPDVVSSFCNTGLLLLWSTFSLCCVPESADFHQTKVMIGINPHNLYFNIPATSMSQDNMIREMYLH